MNNIPSLQQFDDLIELETDGSKEILPPILGKIPFNKAFADYKKNRDIQSSMSIHFNTSSKVETIKTRYRFNGNMMIPDAFETKARWSMDEDRIWEILKPNVHQRNRFQIRSHKRDTSSKDDQVDLYRDKLKLLTRNRQSYDITSSRNNLNLNLHSAKKQTPFMIIPQDSQDFLSHQESMKSLSPQQPKRRLNISSSRNYLISNHSRKSVNATPFESTQSRKQIQRTMQPSPPPRQTIGFEVLTSNLLKKEEDTSIYNRLSQSSSIPHIKKQGAPQKTRTTNFPSVTEIRKQPPANIKTQVKNLKKIQRKKNTKPVTPELQLDKTIQSIKKENEAKQKICLIEQSIQQVDKDLKLFEEDQIIDLQIQQMNSLTDQTLPSNQFELQKPNSKPRNSKKISNMSISLGNSNDGENMKQQKSKIIYKSEKQVKQSSKKASFKIDQSPTIDMFSKKSNSVKPKNFSKASSPIKIQKMSAANSPIKIERTKLNNQASSPMKLQRANQLDPPKKRKSQDPQLKNLYNSLMSQMEKFELQLGTCLNQTAIIDQKVSGINSHVFLVEKQNNVILTNLERNNSQLRLDSTAEFQIPSNVHSNRLDTVGSWKRSTQKPTKISSMELQSNMAFTLRGNSEMKSIVAQKQAVTRIQMKLQQEYLEAKTKDKYEQWLDKQIKSQIEFKSTLVKDWVKLQMLFQKREEALGETIQDLTQEYKAKWVDKKEYMELKHTSPVIIQIFDIIHCLNNENQQLQERHYNEHYLQKLLYFLEIFAMNDLNLVVIEKIDGVKHLVDALFFYKVVGKNAKIQVGILNIIGLCLRNTAISKKFLQYENGSYVSQLFKLSQDYVLDLINDNENLYNYQLVNNLVQIFRLLLCHDADLVEDQQDGFETLITSIFNTVLDQSLVPYEVLEQNIQQQIISIIKKASFCKVLTQDQRACSDVKLSQQILYRLKNKPLHKIWWDFLSNSCSDLMTVLSTEIGFFDLKTIGILVSHENAKCTKSPVHWSQKMFVQFAQNILIMKNKFEKYKGEDVVEDSLSDKTINMNN